MKLISIIVPAYNEAENIPQVIERINRVIRPLEQEHRFEIIVMDNCSTDGTRELVLEHCRQDPRWKFLRYSRNFGTEASMLAGLDHATGDAVINIFSDLQDPPEYILEMLEKWKSGADVVYGVIGRRNDSNRLKTCGARVAYWMIYHLTDCKIPADATDFRLLDRKVVDSLCTLREPDRYYRGLVHWVGFKQVPFSYDRAKRQFGKSNASLFYCVKFALHAIVCFSSKPIQLATLFGFVLTFGTLFMSVVYTVLYFVRPRFLVPPPPGLTTLILLTLFILGINSLFLGIIGEYVGRIYNQGKGRPLYLVAEKVNFS